MAENYMVFSVLMINSVNNPTQKAKQIFQPFVETLIFFSLANLVLEDTVERIYHDNNFAENFHGLFLIRGENVVLLGEIVRPRSLEQPNTNYSYTGSR